MKASHKDERGGRREQIDAAQLSENFRRKITDVHGLSVGAAWLARLPALVAECARRWSLRINPSPYTLSYNYVTPATRADGTTAVLKLGVPGRAQKLEADALAHFDGHGAVRVLESDPSLGALLLQRLDPGTTLTSLASERDDERATLLAAGVMRALRRPAPAATHDFPTLDTWGEGFARMRRHFGGSSNRSPIPRQLADEAETLYRELLDSASDAVLLHGDLHHDNILRDDARYHAWLAIDPQPLVGDSAFEVGAFLRNPMPQLLMMKRPAEVLARRVEILSSELRIKRARLRAWGVANAVLSAWWTVEDHGAGCEQEIACAELLASIRE